jgi:hypothetical protein
VKRDLVRKAVVGTAGTATVATGVALLFLPGPGTVIIIGGLALLRREFPAVGRLLERARDRARRRTGADVTSD